MIGHDILQIEIDKNFIHAHIEIDKNVIHAQFEISVAVKIAFAVL